MNEKEELLKRIRGLERENEALQRTINELRPQSTLAFVTPIDNNFFVPKDNFWTEPLKDYWGQFAKNPMSDFFRPKHGYGLPTEYPWLVAEEEPEDSEKEEMRKKVKELEGLIESLRNELEGISEPLALVVDAIKKEAMLTNVAAAFELLKLMNNIFIDYEPWKKNVRPLEEFLMKEKKNASGNLLYIEQMAVGDYPTMNHE